MKLTDEIGLVVPLPDEIRRLKPHCLIVGCGSPATHLRGSALRAVYGYCEKHAISVHLERAKKLMELKKELDKPDDPEDI